MKKTINKYWPMVKEMSQVTFLLIVGFITLVKAVMAFALNDMEVTKIWGSVAVAAFLFSIAPMFWAHAKSLLPKGK